MIDPRDRNAVVFFLSLNEQEGIARISIDYLNGEVFWIMSGAKKKE
jgi:hypothetical protein